MDRTVLKQWREALVRLRSEAQGQHIRNASERGDVAVTVSGMGQILDIHIDPTVLQGDVRALEQQIKMLLNRSLQEAHETLRSMVLNDIGVMKLPVVDEIGERFLDLHDSLAGVTTEQTTLQNGIKVVVGGHRIVKRLTIDPDVIAGVEPSRFTEALRLVLNDALKRSDNTVKYRLKGLVGGVHGGHWL
jgi:DNA-binding protein YbaB